MPGVVSLVSNFAPTIPQPKGNADTIVASIGSASVPAHLKTAYLAALRAVAESGNLPDYHDGPCSGGQGSGGIGTKTKLGLVTAQAGLQVGLSAIKIGTTALNAVPVLGQILSSAISLISLPFAHHQAAIQKEQATLCQAVPDAQNFLAQVDQYVVTGQWDHVTAVTEMEAGFTAWRREVAGIIHDTAGRCDESCFYERYFRAAIEKRKLDYQQIESTLSQAAARGTKAIETSVTGAVAKVTEFLKTQSAVVAGGDYTPIISALVVGGAIVLALSLLSRLRRPTV
jgi:hypothetical protein